MTSISIDARARREAARQTTGEFGEHAHTAPELALTESPWPADLGATGDWGDVSVEYGARTPWGPAQQAERVADGIVFVPTEGHGGYKLSKERNAAIPPAYRNGSGWYEEDTESHIVRFYHFDAVARIDPSRSRDERLAGEDESLRDWFPEEWERANGRQLEPGESRKKDERVWGEASAGEYVMTSVQGIEDDLVLVTAERRSTGDRDKFILTREQVTEARAEAAEELGAGYRFRVPAGVKPQKRPEPEPQKPAFTTVPSVDGLTAAAAAKVTEDLGQRWRLREDGSVLTLRQQIEQGRITAKTVVLSDTGTRKYYLENENTSSSIKVSKATFDAFEAPDTRTPKDHAREAWQIASTKQRKAQDAVDRSMRPTAEQYRELRAASAAERAAYETYTNAPEA
jgi:hypothetical protein